MEITFNNLPEAVNGLNERLATIEHLIRDQKPQQGDEDNILTLAQVAELLQLSKPTIYNYVAKNAIPHSKKGARLFFSKKAVLDWLNK